MLMCRDCANKGWAKHGLLGDVKCPVTGRWYAGTKARCAMMFRCMVYLDAINNNKLDKICDAIWSGEIYIPEIEEKNNE